MFDLYCDIHPIDGLFAAYGKLISHMNKKISNFLVLILLILQSYVILHVTKLKCEARGVPVPMTASIFPSIPPEPSSYCSSYR